MYDYNWIENMGAFEGDMFTSEQQVRDYFTVENFEHMYNYCPWWQWMLTEMADNVIKNKWHCNF